MDPLYLKNKSIFIFILIYNLHVEKFTSGKSVNKTCSLKGSSQSWKTFSCADNLNQICSLSSFFVRFIVLRSLRKEKYIFNFPIMKQTIFKIKLPLWRRARQRQFQKFSFCLDLFSISPMEDWVETNNLVGNWSSFYRQVGEWFFPCFHTGFFHLS